jgi:hypothetical protein
MFEKHPSSDDETGNTKSRSQFAIRRQHWEFRQALFSGRLQDNFLRLRSAYSSSNNRRHKPHHSSALGNYARNCPPVYSASADSSLSHIDDREVWLLVKTVGST